MTNSIEKSRRQAAKRKAERQAKRAELLEQGLTPNPGGRPRNNPLFLAKHMGTGGPVGRPRKVDDWIDGVKVMIRERDANPDETPSEPAWRHYEHADSMQEDLERYAKYLPILFEAMRGQETERLLALACGEKVPRLPALPCPPMASYHPKELEEVLAWGEARRAIERDFFKGKQPVRLFPGLVEAPEDEDFPEEWDDKPHPEASSSAPPAEPAQPAFPPKQEGEKYKEYVKRVAATIGCSFFPAQEAVKQYGLWKK
ncbi:MAG: hypothetical protein B7Z80_19550 [Rhodospirillales bacterium 20-64-7]|nr:MAG: hypothetical protein B7Z80_19550 [Rhodospirillales bacterium 20-64-7]